MSRHKNKIIGLLICVGIFAAAGFAFAQPNLGLNEFGAQTNLGTKPIGQTIAEIVRVFLSVLGIIAVILILYAGFLYMTAGGDAAKIATAKKLIFSAIIGLAIILSALAITQFIIGALEKATGSSITEEGAGPGGGGGGFGGGIFSIKGISPQGNIPIRNVTVKVFFNNAPDPSLISGNILVIRKSDNSIANMNFSANGDTVQLIPDSSCPAPNENAKCLEADTAYRVEVKPALKDMAGKNLVCGGLAPQCVVEFTTGSLVDIKPPQISITYPDPGQAVPQNSFVDVWASAVDDSAISNIDFFADGAYFNKDFPAIPASQFSGQALWNTDGAALGGHNLSAKAYDIDSNNAFSPTLAVTVSPEHCFNGVKDFTETDIDCGGDCGACAGASCQSASECVSGVCQNGVCANIPLILGVSPANGAAGTFITISGKYFGGNGSVTFLGGVGTGDDRTAGLAPCAGAWRDTEVIAMVPAGAANGPIEIKTSIGADATNDVRGPVLPDFVTSQTVRPGICSLSPKEGKSGTVFSISGRGFGASQGTSAVKFGNVFALPQSWADVSVSAVVPVLSAGSNSVRISRDGIDSNALAFQVLDALAGTKPAINYIDPASGPAGEYISIFGSNFGDADGVVQFVRADGAVAAGDTNFPAACGAVDYWRNSSITVKVPDKFSDGSSTRNTAVSVRARRADAALSNVIPFSINSAAPNPGICGLKPNNGPAGTAVDIVGERFGAAGAITFYNNVAGAFTAWGTEIIKTAVPKGAVSGPVKVTAGGKNSNSVNFSVGDCAANPGICSESEQCCASSCVPKTQTCQAAPKEGAYAWKFSTGFIPKSPKVVEDCSVGKTAKTPSPSPWDSRPGGKSVCVNAVINVRFDSKIDPLTLIMNGVAADTAALWKCTGGAANPCAAKTKIALNSVYSSLYAAGTNEDGFQMYPQSGILEKNTQYLVELTTGIRGAGAGGGNMEENEACGPGVAYCFKFKTADSDGLCRVGSLAVSPQEMTAKKKEFLEYLAIPRDKDDVCLAINASSYVYGWNSSQPANAAVAGTGSNLKNQKVANAAIINTLNETPAGNPALITSAIASENVSGQGVLTVDFIDPAVVQAWPSCDTACVNAVVGAEFNTEMNAATLIPANIEVYKCQTENCDAFDGPPLAGSIEYNEDSMSFNFTPSAPFAVNSFYLARLNALNIKSSSGVALTGANSGKYFTWQFRTRNDNVSCALNKVLLNPSSEIFNYIGEVKDFIATGIGAPDGCSPTGQKLNSLSFAWAWASAAPAVASLVNNGAFDVSPAAGGGCSAQCLHTGSKPGASVCGNGVKEKGEDCDDGNASAGDGCSSVCLAEGSAATCGNGVKDAGENCDDGNKISGDGCSSVCLAEGSGAGKSICGNGAVGKGETCDDGNAASGDGCSSQCLNEGTESGIGSCGNNIAETELGEDCDDGNAASGDGCSANCLNEGSAAAFAKYGSVCGNGGTPEKGEDCDDGNAVSGDGCSASCLNEGSDLNFSPSGSVCGNDVPEKGEDCDEGGGDGRVDPRQYAKAAGQGKTKISATAQNVAGSADAEVMCVYTTDVQCQQFSANLGAGKDNCCHPKPQVVNGSIVPLIGQTGVCRNTLISAAFNQLMDASAGEISIDRKKAAAPCPVESVLSKDGLWCEGAVKAARDSYDEIDKNQTVFNWSISNVLDANAQYRVRLNNFKNKSGVAAVNFVWTFTTGADICKIDAVEITPEPIIFYNTKPLSSDNPNGSPQLAKARAISFKTMSDIVSVAGIYAWDWSWSPASTNSISLNNASANPVIISAKAQNGEETLQAAANITADKFGLTPEKSVAGTARVIVFLCEKPWPGLSNFPMQIDTTANASTYYCRDASPELPSLKMVPGGSSGDLLKEYLFVDSASGDALGLRIYANPNHLSPLAWYKSKLFAGNPTASKVDGYEAVIDGRSIYVNAANHLASGANYTNIFVISYNQGASAAVQNIYNQILKNWKFNTNLDNILLCQGTNNACQSDLDCSSGRVCNADKDKIRRDAKRLADFNDLAELLENYKQKNNTYPQILAGSFLRGRSVSAWPSWQATLGNDLGKALAADPINKHGVCGGDYDAATCWNGKTGTYLCPIGSRVYNYSIVTQDKYELGAELEYNFGNGWGDIGKNFIVRGFCSGAPEGISAKCGDGIVGEGEQCEKGITGTESCTVNSKTGFRKLTCNASTCQWDASAPCQAGQCGDGVKQAGEFCDDGQNNGKYGFCNTSCNALSGYCGDSVQSASEACDLGAQNGVYGSGCSWDCKVPGPSCGDKIIQSSYEACDGNSETAKSVAGFDSCAVNKDGYETQRTRNCLPPGSVGQCQWGGWGNCLPVGVCGNGIKEGAEECDDGNSNNSDGCVIDSAKGVMCKTAICGDGYVETAKEICDQGSNNGKPCSAAYGLTCNYCGASCNLLTVTGGYCGDGKFDPKNEECEGKNFGNLACADFNLKDKICSTVNGVTGCLCPTVDGKIDCSANLLQCTSLCKISTSQCLK